MHHDLPGYPIQDERYPTAEDCWRLCKSKEKDGCRLWSWVDFHSTVFSHYRGWCYLKYVKAVHPMAVPDYISGSLDCNPVSGNGTDYMAS